MTDITNFLGAYSNSFTESGLRIFEKAFDESCHHQQNGVSYGHILKALKDEEPILLNKTLNNLKADTPLTDEFLDSIIEGSHDSYGKPIPLSLHVVDICRNAMDVARADNRRKIEVADLVLAIERMVLSVAPWLRTR